MTSGLYHAVADLKLHACDFAGCPVFIRYNNIT